MKNSWTLRVLLLVAFGAILNFCAAIWMDIEFIFAGAHPSVADWHSNLSGAGFLSLEHLFLHLWQIVQVLGFIGLVVGVPTLFVWLETGMQELKGVWQKETPFLQVGHKKVRVR